MGEVGARIPRAAEMHSVSDAEQKWLGARWFVFPSGELFSLPVGPYPIITSRTFTERALLAMTIETLDTTTLFLSLSADGGRSERRFAREDHLYSMSRARRPSR